MSEHFYDFCYTIDLLATNDNVPYVDGCMIATEIDEFEAFTVSLMQEIISKEENDMFIFMEEVDEDVTDHVEEEENRPPMNLSDESYELWDQLILSFGNEQKESEDEPLSLAERLRKKLSNMTKIRKGLTADSGAADHVMPVGGLIMSIVLKSLGAMRGVHYVAAEGTRIANVGQQLKIFMTIDCTWTEIMF